MRSQAKQLRALSSLTGAALKAKQAEMARMKQQEADIRNRIAALQRRPSGEVGDVDPATRVGADALWQIWVDNRRMALTTGLARNLAAQDRLRHELARLFGRDMAVESLAKKENARVVAARARKSAYGN
jgi:hypothetical protein